MNNKRISQQKIMHENTNEYQNSNKCHSENTERMKKTNLDSVIFDKSNLMRYKKEYFV